MTKYPVVLSRDTNGTILVSFPDVPEAHTFGEDDSEALACAVDALETALSMYIEHRREVPKPSPVKKRAKCVVLPALTEAKVALYQAMRQAGIKKAELARRLGWHMPQVDRLLDLNHASRLDQLEAAFAALDKRLSVSVQDAA
jgi:antitoxin HicB